MDKLAMLAGALALGGACAPALAFDSGGFVRAEAGNTDIEVQVDGLSSQDDDTSVNLRGGYYFNPFIAVEGFYGRYAKQSNPLADSTLDGFGAGVVGKYNFGPNYDGFYVSGRAGIARVSIDVEGKSFGEVSSIDWDDDATTAYLGLGVGYDFNGNFGLGLNYDHAEPSFTLPGGGPDVGYTLKTVSLSVEYRF